MNELIISHANVKFLLKVEVPYALLKNCPFHLVVTKFRIHANIKSMGYFQTKKYYESSKSTQFMPPACLHLGSARLKHNFLNHFLPALYFITKTLDDFQFPTVARRGARGKCSPPQFLADQLTLSQPVGRIHYCMLPGFSDCLTIITQ